MRAQIDREQYLTNVQDEMQKTKNLKIIEASVEDLLIDSDDGRPKVNGVCLSKHTDFLGLARFDYFRENFSMYELNTHTSLNLN